MVVSPLLGNRKHDTETSLSVDTEEDNSKEIIQEHRIPRLQTSEDDKSSRSETSSGSDEKINDYQKLLEEHKAYEIQKAIEVQQRLEQLQRKLRVQREKAEIEAKVVAEQLVLLPQTESRKVNNNEVLQFSNSYSSNFKTADEELRELQEKLRLDLENVYITPLVRRQKNKHDLRYIHKPNENLLSSLNSSINADDSSTEDAPHISVESTTQPKSLGEKVSPSSCCQRSVSQATEGLGAALVGSLHNSRGYTTACCAPCCQQASKYGRKNLYLCLSNANNNNNNINTCGSTLDSETTTTRKDLYWNDQDNFIAKEMRYETQNLYQSNELLNEKLSPSQSGIPPVTKCLNLNTDRRYPVRNCISSSSDCSPVDSTSKYVASSPTTTRPVVVSGVESPLPWNGDEPRDYVKRRHKEGVAPRLFGCPCCTCNGEYTRSVL